MAGRGASCSICVTTLQSSGHGGAPASAGLMYGMARTCWLQACPRSRAFTARCSSAGVATRSSARMQSTTALSTKGVRLAQKIPVGPYIAVGMQL